MAIVRWDPFREMMTLRNAMDRMFEDSIVPRIQSITNGGEAPMALDVYQTDDEVVIKAALPGVKPEDVDISITGDTVTIKGEMKEETEVKEENYLHRERRYGTFSRIVQVPVSVREDQAEATFEDGVLKLSLPKAEEVKPRQIKVKARNLVEGEKK